MTAVPPDTRPHLGEWISGSLLAAACIAAPLCLGATAPWSRFAVEATTALAVALWALAVPHRWRITWAPIGIATLFMLQLLALPDQLLGFISPVAMGAWKVALADSPTTWGRISVDPAATASAIRRLLLAAGVIVAVRDLGRHTPLRRLLCGALCLVCVTIWTLGLAFPFDRKTLVVLGTFDFTGPIAAESWKTPVEPPISTNGSGNLEWVRVGDQRYESPMWIAADAFGPYIYANHFASALSLTLPVLLGAWLTATRRRLPNLARHALAVAVFAGALWTSGILATSRAGAAGLLLAALVFASLTIERLWARRTATALCIVYGFAVLAFMVILYGGFHGLEGLVPNQYRPRVAALLSDGRALAARTALNMFLAAPLLGSGLATFGDLFPRLLRTDFLLHYAHNDYAQWLAEAGLVGASVAVGFVAMLGTSFRRWWQTVIRQRRGDPLTAGVWAGLAGLGLHTAFDWNLHIPANALLACVAAGIALASGTASVADPAASALPRRMLRAWLPAIALCAACLIAAALLARDAASDDTQRDLRRAIVAARIATADPQSPSADAALHAATAAGEQMFRWDSANGRLAVLIGLARLHLAAMPDAAPSERAAAEEWFSRSQRRCAVCRGLPEPVPVQPQAIPSP
ncbi:MAG: O-antigen ligase family protein [Pirellulales bacterium]